MSFFGFDPESVAARLRAAGQQPGMLTLTQSMRRGSLGFGAVSVVVYGVWAVAGRALASRLGEAGFYAVCAVLFIALAGWALSGLVVERAALGRFYGLFAAAFGIYAVGWCAAWFGLARAITGTGAGWAGSLLGTALMGWVLLAAFGARGVAASVLVVLFATHSTGYFLGDYCYTFFKTERALQLFGGALDKAALATLSKFLWGAAYGLSFGAGLGYALHVCQEPARAKLSPAQK